MDLMVRNLGGSQRGNNHGQPRNREIGIFIDTSRREAPLRAARDLSQAGRDGSRRLHQQRYY